MYGVVLDAKWWLSLVSKVITFMVTFGVKNVGNVLNYEQNCGNPNDSYAVTITKKPFLAQTACSTLLTCFLAAFTCVLRVQTFRYQSIIMLIWDAAKRHKLQ